MQVVLLLVSVLQLLPVVVLPVFKTWSPVVQPQTDRQTDDRRLYVSKTWVLQKLAKNAEDT